jgi:hypothetical protein
MDIKLEIGKTYKITHTRKGAFVAQLIDIVSTDPGDEQDVQLLRCKIDTRRGTGQERLARTHAEITVTDIRPSLIAHIEEVESDAWLLQRRVVEEDRAAQMQYEKDLERTVKKVLETQAKTLPKKKPGIIDFLFGRNRKNPS